MPNGNPVPTTFNFYRYSLENTKPEIPALLMLQGKNNSLISCKFVFLRNIWVYNAFILRNIQYNC